MEKPMTHDFNSMEVDPQLSHNLNTTPNQESPVRQRNGRYGRHHPLYEGGESRTVQADPSEWDPNLIIKRFARTGFMPPQKGTPQYADVSELQGNYKEMVNKRNQILQDEYMRQRAKAGDGAVVETPTEDPSTLDHSPAEGGDSGPGPE